MKKLSTGLTPWSSRRLKDGATDGHCLEYWARCRAGPAQPEVEKEKKKEAQSCKLQAPSLTVTEGYYRMSYERNNMDTIQLKRIADAIEEILRLIKKDMEPRTKKKD